MTAKAGNVVTDFKVITRIYKLLVRMIIHRLHKPLIF